MILTLSEVEREREILEAVEVEMGLEVEEVCVQAETTILVERASDVVWVMEVCRRRRVGEAAAVELWAETEEHRQARAVSPHSAFPTCELLTSSPYPDEAVELARYH